MQNKKTVMTEKVKHKGELIAFRNILPEGQSDYFIRNENEFVKASCEEFFSTIQKKADERGVISWQK
jgi:hypothetical protein